MMNATKENKKEYYCCICGERNTGWGNNPDGACCLGAENKVVELHFDENARCCDDCNSRYVILGKLYLMAKRREENK